MQGEAEHPAIATAFDEGCKARGVVAVDEVWQHAEIAPGFAPAHDVENKIFGVGGVLVNVIENAVSRTVVLHGLEAIGERPLVPSLGDEIAGRV